MLSTTRKRAYELICMSLVFSYPEILRRPRANSSLLPYSPTAERYHDWRLHDNGVMTTRDTTMLVSVHKARTTRDADRAAAESVPGGSVSFRTHPQLTRLAQLWGRTARWRPRRRTLRLLCKPERTATGVAKRDRRIRLRAEGLTGPTGAAIVDGLNTLHWRTSGRILGGSAEVGQHIHRKAGTLTY